MKTRPEQCTDSFSGKLVVITGATSGIGLYAARKYASMGARLVLINRNKEKSEQLCRNLSDEFGAKADYITADLTLLEDIQHAGRALAELEQPIDVLIHNAGLHLETRHETADGLEANFALHYIAPFVITKMLEPKMSRDRAGRIIFVGSEGYRFAVWGLDLDDLQWERNRYSGLKAYGAGKLAQLLSMHIFAQELAPYNVTINAMHPGMVRTETGKDNGKLYQWYKKNFIDTHSATPDISAEALYYLGVSRSLAQTSDVFFHLTTAEELAPPARDMEAAQALWTKTIDLLGQKGVRL
ncbi:MAG: SDR family NAD(P)-dependent oxidoreductase [Spirochaetales bacterium]|nr:SDR family NAD(P)-dependent oxidoreductase [Spirochaetales bacterium]